MTRTAAAFRLSLQQLAQGGPQPHGRLRLWTFTLPTVKSTAEAKEMCNRLLSLLRLRFPRMWAIRVFELHHAHGLHVHLVTPNWLYVGDVRAMAESVGWGRINVRTIPVTAAGNYLSKKFGRRERCLAGWRLWDSIGKWVSTRVKDVVVNSAFTRIYQACKRRLGWESNHDFLHRMRIVNWMLRRTICEGWTDGFGPGGRPYEEFDFHQLLGGGLRYPGMFAA